MKSFSHTYCAVVVFIVLLAVSSHSCFHTKTREDEYLFKDTDNQEILEDFISRNAHQLQWDSVMFMISLLEGQWQPSSDEVSTLVDFKVTGWPVCYDLDEIHPDSQYCQVYMIKGYNVLLFANGLNSVLPEIINIKKETSLLEQLSKEARSSSRCSLRSVSEYFYYQNGKLIPTAPPISWQ